MRALKLALCASLLVQSVPVLAEPGVSAKEILIGSCSAQSGPAENLGIKQLKGAMAYIDRINASGGINGRKIKVLVEDDKYEPEAAIGCFKRLVDAEVFAGAFFVGTPTAAKYAPMATASKLPIVGLFTGAGLLRDPFKRYIVNVRASYGDEMRTQVDHLWNDAGMKKFAVIYQDDAFGVAVLEATKKALKAHNAEPIAIGSFQRNTTNVDGAIEQVKAAKPDAVVIVGPYKPVAQVLKSSHAKGWRPQFTTVSFVGTESLIAEAGEDADGMVITQVVPPYNRKDLPAVAAYLKDLAKSAPTEKPSFTSLEGYVDAMVLVEGLKRAGKDLTREGLIDAIESLHDHNLGLGDNKLDYGPNDHAGLKELFPTVIKGGEAKAFTDWTKLKS